jgi:tripartite-type tricarboxylate transporter receptor subunit TctC
MFNRRRFIKLTSASLVAPAVLSASRAFGAAWQPTKPVRVIVPFPPGGSTDTTARIVSAQLSAIWNGATVVVENRGGAGGNIATDLVAKAEADGHTILIVGPGLATNQFLYAKLTYDPVADFAPVSQLINQPNIMAVPNSSPAKTVQEFIDYVNSSDKKGHATYGSSGVGTTLHLSGELFKHLTHVEMTHVPYKGGGPAINDLIPGRIDVTFDNAPSILPHIQASEVRGVAVTTKERVKVIPQYPTIAETVPGFDVSSWFGFFVPVKTSPEIVTALNAATVKAVSSEAVSSKLTALGADPKSSTPQELAAFLQSEIAKWGPVIKDASIKAAE